MASPYKDPSPELLDQVARDTWYSPGGIGSGVSDETAREIGYTPPYEVKGPRVDPHPGALEAERRGLTGPQAARYALDSVREQPPSN